MSELIQYLVSGVALGCTFALIASGIVVIARVTGAVNFAQGVFSVLAGLITASLLHASLPHGLAELIALIICAIVGLLAGFIILGKRGTSHQSMMIISIGVGILLYAPMVLIWGDLPVPLEGIGGALTIAGVRLSYQYLLIIVVTVLAFAALVLFFNRT